MKPQIKSKTVLWSWFLFIVGLLNAIFNAVDITKLPPDVVKLIVPVIAVITYLFRIYKSDIKGLT